MHGMHVDNLIADSIVMVHEVIKIRKAELLSMQLQLDTESGKARKTIILSHWCEGLHAALSAVLDNYIARAPLLREEGEEGPSGKGHHF